MKKNSLLSSIFKALFIDVGLKGAFQGAFGAIKTFLGEHEEEFNDLVQREETED